MQKITPFLWFDSNTEEAVNFYTSIFKNSQTVSTTHYAEGAHRPKGMVMTVTFQLNKQDFIALNGGFNFRFSPAISFCSYLQRNRHESWRQS